MKKASNSYIEQIRENIFVMILEDDQISAHRWNVVIDLLHPSFPEIKTLIDGITVSEWIRRLLDQKVLKSTIGESPFSNVVEIKSTKIEYVIEIIYQILRSRIDSSVNIEIEINECS